MEHTQCYRTLAHSCLSRMQRHYGTALVNVIQTLTKKLPNPVAERVFLEEFFSQVFKIPFRKRNGSGDRDFVVA